MTEGRESVQLVRERAITRQIDGPTKSMGLTVLMASMCRKHLYRFIKYIYLQTQSSTGLGVGCSRHVMYFPSELPNKL